MKRPDRYGIAAIPAPPRKPKGKAKVEAGVLIAQRWILARLRNRIFFTLAELNNAIAELVEELNTPSLPKAAWHATGSLREHRPTLHEAAVDAAFRAAPA